MTATHSKTHSNRSAHTSTMLHFPWQKVAAALAELRGSSGLRTLYGRNTDKGLWLVGDRGVYLMPNTTAKERTVIYARECDPTTMDFDTWWAAKRATFGGDDGIEFIAIEEIEGLTDAPPMPGVMPKHLAIAITPERLTLSIVWNSKPPKGETV